MLRSPYVILVVAVAAVLSASASAQRKTSFAVTATNTLADQSFVASPAVAAGDLYLRSRTHLFRISDRR